MYDVTKMSQAEIAECSKALGALGAGASSTQRSAVESTNDVVLS